MIDSLLYAYMEEQLRRTPDKFKRYLYNEIPWDNQMTGITGAKGIGKSTMIRQYILEHRSKKHFLYVSADHTWFSNHLLTELADDFVKEGGTHLFIDEIHKYKNWSRELKQIYDVHPELHVIFTGSSILELESHFYRLFHS